MRPAWRPSGSSPSTRRCAAALVLFRSGYASSDPPCVSPALVDALAVKLAASPSDDVLAFLATRAAPSQDTCGRWSVATTTDDLDRFTETMNSAPAAARHAGVAIAHRDWSEFLCIRRRGMSVVRSDRDRNGVEVGQYVARIQLRDFLSDVTHSWRHRTGFRVPSEAEAAAFVPRIADPPRPRVQVRHAKFGEGTVVTETGDTVLVDFPDGRRRLLRSSLQWIS